MQQNLRFKYSDLEKLPQTLDDICLEIKQSCPTLITDGSKPFQAVLTQYESDHVEALVRCHFNIAPVDGSSVLENQQQVLLAIARAIKRNNVEFAPPSILYQTKNGEDPLEHMPKS